MSSFLKPRAAGRRGVPLLCAVAIGFLLVSASASADPGFSPTSGAISGFVDVDGQAIPGAVVTLGGNGNDRTGRTDIYGNFAIYNVPGGIYIIRVLARGFNSLTGRTLDVVNATTTRVSLQLRRSSSSLTTIGEVTTHQGSALSTSSVPTQELDAQAAAARGERSVGDMIARDAISATLIHPAGANPAAPLVVALRGPDPTETLVDIDGHSINSGGTGAFDLSLLDPADLSSVQLVYGISPSSLVGPNTIDGAINVRTLEPTTKPHALLRLSAGSFGAFGQTLRATGTQNRFGYAFSLHRAVTGGEVHSQIVLTSDGSTPTVGAAMDATTALGKFRYTFGRGDAFVALTFREQNQFRDLSAALTSVAADANGAPVYNSFAGSSLLGHNAGYGIDVQLPLGSPAADGFAHTTMLVRHLTSNADQSVFGRAAGSSLYLYNDRDLLGDDSLEIDRTLPKATLTLEFTARNEQLDTQQVIAAASVDQYIARRQPQALPAAATNVLTGVQPLSGLSQQQRSAVIRYAFEPTAKLHYTLATYYSNFNSFGTSLDPRFGFVWTPTAQTSVRASAGSTFQSPQLPELYVPPALPPPDSNGYYDIGNAHLKADHATDFDLGFEHVFSAQYPLRASIDLYRTDLRTPSQRYLPATNCLPPTGPAPAPASCESYPINAGGAVYQGIELRVQRSLSRSAFLRAAYSVNSNYTTNVSPLVQDGTIVAGEQFLATPLHRGTLSFERVGTAVSYTGGLTYEDGYNGLHRPAYATLQAGLTWHLRAGFEAGLYATNLTNVYADRFTHAGTGVPYGGVAGPIATDAYALEGRAVNFAFTRRF